ncbi:MAG: geranylgeranyl reductase family protein [Thermoanaerobaculia bacterium]
MRNFDVAIVGCGPAGNIAAWHLAARGVEVALLERATLPRPKTCGGGLSRKTLEEIPYDIDPVVESEIESAFVTSGGSTFLQSKERIGVTVCRDRLDSYMARQAVEKGVTLLESCTLESFSIRRDHVRLETSRGAFSAGVLIGADGVYSGVRRALDTSCSPFFAPAIEALVYVEPARTGLIDGGCILDFDAIPHGYGWVFPKRDHYNVGLYRYRRSRGGPGMRGMLQAFIERFPQLHSPLRVVTRGYSIPVRRAATVVDPGGVLLAGDAAGLAENVYGEGICFAVRSGRLAAETVAATLGGSGDLSEYAHRLRPLMRELALSRFTASLVYAGSPGMRRRLSRSGPISRRFTGLLTGDNGYAACLIGTAACLPFAPLLPQNREQRSPLDLQT